MKKEGGRSHDIGSTIHVVRLERVQKCTDSRMCHVRKYLLRQPPFARTCMRTRMPYLSD
jgi:hypothetical protein